MRRLTALALAGVAAAAVLAAVPALPAAAAASSYCFEDTSTDLYIGSTTSGNLVPLNQVCRVEFVRVNYHELSGIGFYEYKVDAGPNQGLCLKEDPGINTDGFHPVVDYACDNGNDATRNEELWTDPPTPQPYESSGWYMITIVGGIPEGLYTWNVTPAEDFALQLIV
jgi:hypothetical protein